MRILNYRKFFEKLKDNNVILYYCFDFDDNILRMPTVIHMDKLVNGKWIPTDVSTAEFAQVRSDKENWRLRDDAFSEFGDNGPRGDVAFIEDMKTALGADAKAPAWEDFIECLVNGSLFAIITARGHEAPSIRKGVEYIIDEILDETEQDMMYNNLLKYKYLFDYDADNYERVLKGKPTASKIVKTYLDNCEYVGVSAPSRGGTPDNPEKAKEEALLKFGAKVNNFAKQLGVSAKIGFSDDDAGNVNHINDLFANLKHEEFSNIIEYIVKDTSSGDVGGIERTVRTVEDYHEAPGMQSSVLPHWDNIANRLGNDRVDIPKDDAMKQYLNDVKLLWDKFKDIPKDELKDKDK